MYACAPALTSGAGRTISWQLAAQQPWLLPWILGQPQPPLSGQRRQLAPQVLALRSLVALVALRQVASLSRSVRGQLGRVRARRARTSRVSLSLASLSLASR